MTVAELIAKLNKLDPNLVVLAEGEQGKKYHVITAKERIVKAGHEYEPYCWLPLRTEK